MTFANGDEAIKARDNLNGRVVDGRKIEVSITFNWRLRGIYCLPACDAVVSIDK